MKPSVRTRLAISIAAIVLVAAACGSDDSSGETDAPAATTAAAPTTAAATTTAGVSIELGDTSLGQVLTSDGLTLYVFTPDEGGTPTCVDACAAAWPPLIGDAGTAGTGVEADGITVVHRPDGSEQLAYHGWPLYFYAADQAPGDVIGQGLNGKWFVLGADGTPIEAAAG